MSNINKLTIEDLKVFILIGEGLPYKDIAYKFNFSYSNVSAKLKKLSHLSKEERDTFCMRLAKHREILDDLVNFIDNDQQTNNQEIDLSSL